MRLETKMLRANLRELAIHIGRNASDVAKPILYVGDANAGGATDRFLAEMAGYAKLGVSTVIVMPLDKEPVAFLERLGSEVIPRLAEL